MNLEIIDEEAEKSPRMKIQKSSSNMQTMFGNGHRINYLYSPDQTMAPFAIQFDGSDKSLDMSSPLLPPS